MTNANEIIAKAGAQLQKGELREAEVTLSAIWNQGQRPPAAKHLLGLIRAAQGRIGDSEVLLRTAVEEDPRSAEYRNSLGNLLRKAGFLIEAEKEYATALTLDPAHARAKLNRAGVLTQLEFGDVAESLARDVARAMPQSAPAWNAVAAACLQQKAWARGLEAARTAFALEPQNVETLNLLGNLCAKNNLWDEAEKHFTALSVNVRRAPTAIVSYGVALQEGGKLDQAQAMFEEAIARAPNNPDAHERLAMLLWMRGDKEMFASRALKALENDPRDRALRVKIADVLRRADRNQEAAFLLREGLVFEPDEPGLTSALSVVLSNLGETGEAVRLADTAVAALPQIETLRKNAVSAHLMHGDGKGAAPHVQWGRARAPLDQEWLALEASTLRATGDARYRTLYDYQRFVKVSTLTPPAGFASIDQFNDALAQRLRQLHGATSAHPLDQSLRGGTQTPVGILDSKDPVIQGFIAALDKPIRAMMEAIGNDPGHPFTARNTGRYRFSGCWSVRLVQGGSHVNHMHPQGWISSAYYVTVPPDIQDQNTKAGWLSFGEPRFSAPNQGPEAFVQPQPGTLALFPSYMWHGVRPFNSGAERMTIAFDVVPV